MTIYIIPAKMDAWSGRSVEPYATVAKKQQKFLYKPIDDDIRWEYSYSIDSTETSKCTSLSLQTPK